MISQPLRNIQTRFYQKEEVGSSDNFALNQRFKHLKFYRMMRTLKYFNSNVFDNFTSTQNYIRGDKTVETKPDQTLRETERQTDRQTDRDDRCNTNERWLRRLLGTV